MRPTQSTFSVLALALLFGLSAVPSAHSQTFTWIGDDTVIGHYSWSVTAKGAVVGWAQGGNFVQHGFRWTPHEGMRLLNPGNNTQENPYGSSLKGDVVVGTSGQPIETRRAFRWTEEHGMQYLGSLAGRSTGANAVSQNGEVVVGWSYIDSNRYRAFRWTKAEGMRALEGPEYTRTSARAMNKDGTVIIGTALIGGHWPPVACRWTSTHGYELLHPGNGRWSETFAVSEDGNVVVGWYAEPSSGARAFRWTPETGMQDLGALGGVRSYAYSMTSDGSSVVGLYRPLGGTDDRAYRWTQVGGVEDLMTVYGHLMTPGSHLHLATAISSDGRYIIGNGTNGLTGRSQVWLIDTVPEPATWTALAVGLGCLRWMRRRR